jgi:predicted small lipoprotein YifL
MSIFSQRVFLAAVLLSVACFATGCGKKGPLYLPEPAKETQRGS